MAIDRDSPVPLYYQIRQMLEQRIQDGEWKAGDMLPTESQLQTEYGVSRITVRQALSDLEQEGLITRIQGKGTFVSQPKLVHGPAPTHSLADYLHDQGMASGWKLLKTEWMIPPREVSSRLQIDAAEEVFHIRRLRLANSEPIGYHIAWVSPRFADNIDMSALADGGSLRYLRKDGLLDNSFADRTLEAISASAAVARHLKVEEGSPLLMIRRLVRSKEDTPIEDFRGMYRGDRFQYHIHQLPAVHPINA